MQIIKVNIFFICIPLDDYDFESTMQTSFDIEMTFSQAPTSNKIIYAACLGNILGSVNVQQKTFISQ